MLVREKCQKSSCETDIASSAHKCGFCGGLFCEEHKDPSNHDCTGLSQPNKMYQFIKKEEKKMGAMFFYVVALALFLLLFVFCLGITQ